MTYGVRKPQSLSQETCPFMGGKKMCTVCHKCNFWEHIRGENPNTGEKIDRWDCTLKLQYLMQMENNKFTYELGAAIESMRNQQVEYSRMALRMQYRDQPDALSELNKMFKVMDAKIAAQLQITEAQRRNPKPQQQLEAPTHDKQIEDAVELGDTEFHRVEARQGAKRGATKKPRTTRQPSRKRR
jgi:hypothetical protein